jgi:hypothetical protein
VGRSSLEKFEFLIILIKLTGNHDLYRGYYLVAKAAIRA